MADLMDRMGSLRIGLLTIDNCQWLKKTWLFMVIPQFWLSENFGCRASNQWLGRYRYKHSILWRGEDPWWWTPGHLCASSWITHARSRNNSPFVDELLNSSEFQGCGFFLAAFLLTGPNTKQIQASLWWDQESCEARMSGCSLIQCSAMMCYLWGIAEDRFQNGRKKERRLRRRKVTSLGNWTDSSGETFSADPYSAIGIT